MDYIVTIPKKIKWEDYEKELKTVEDRSAVMRFRTPVLINASKGDRCFIVWNGRVRGWMEIVGVFKAKGTWRCTTSGNLWPPGNYVERSGPFHAVDGPEMKGFQGVRRYNKNLREL